MHFVNTHFAFIAELHTNTKLLELIPDFPHSKFVIIRKIPLNFLSYCINLKNCSYCFSDGENQKEELKHILSFDLEKKKVVTLYF